VLPHEHHFDIFEKGLRGCVNILRFGEESRRCGVHCFLASNDLSCEDVVSVPPAHIKVKQIKDFLYLALYHIQLLYKIN